MIASRDGSLRTDAQMICQVSIRGDACVELAPKPFPRCAPGRHRIRPEQQRDVPSAESWRSETFGPLNEFFQLWCRVTLPPTVILRSI